MMTASPNRIALFRLLLVGILVGLVVQTGTLRSLDTVRRLQLTRSLWTDAPEVLEPWPLFGVLDDQGRAHAWYGVGQSLLFLPSDMVAAAITRGQGFSAENTARLQRAVVSSTVYPVIAGLCLAGACWWLTGLGLSTRSATFGALALLFGTSLLYWTHGGQENSLMLLCTLAACAGAAHWASAGRPAFAAIAIFALGFTILIRPVASAVAGIGVAATLFATRDHWRRLPRRAIRHAALITLLISVPFAIAERVAHYLRFNEWWGTYLGRLDTYKAAHPELPANWPMSGALIDGLLGQTVSARSVLYFEPLLLLLPLVIWLFRKPVAPAAARAAAGVMLMLAFAILTHSKLEFWYGSHSWGPRYITVPAEMAGALAVGILASTWRLLSRLQKRAAGTLVVVAVAVQVSSIIFDVSLEIVQGTTRTPVVVQRFINIWDFFTAGDARTLGWRMYPGGAPHVTLFPWLGDLYLGAKYGMLALALWLAMVAAALTMTVRTIRSVGE